MTAHGYPNMPRQAMNDSRYETVVISGNSKENVIGKITHLLGSGLSEKDLQSALYIESKLTHRDRGGIRVGFMLAPKDNVFQVLREALAAIKNGDRSERVILKMNHDEHPVENICIVFPGLGVHYLGMGLSLEERFVPAKNLFARANQTAKKRFGFSISDLIRGTTKHNGMTADETLSLSQFSNPAILTVSMAILEILRAIGLKPDSVIGASLGEYGSLVSSGALPFEEAICLVHDFGRIAVEFTPSSRMAAVQLDEITIRSVLAESNGHVEIANFNSPSQVVITGTTEGVERVLMVLQSKGITAVPLRISVGYHCDLVKAANDRFLPSLDTATWRLPHMEVYSTVGNSGIYPKKGIAEFAKKTIGQMLTQKVHFQQQVNAASQSGRTAFIDLGPSTVMADLIRQMGGESYGMLRQSDDELLYFMRSLLRLSMAVPQLDATRLNDIQVDVYDQRLMENKHNV